MSWGHDLGVYCGALLMGGIAGLFMYVEILEIPMVYDDASGIHVSVRNTGTVFKAIVAFLLMVFGKLVGLRVDGRGLSQSRVKLNPG